MDQKVIDALRLLRDTAAYGWSGMNPKTVDAFNTLDNAGIFREIDEATGYDIGGNDEEEMK